MASRRTVALRRKMRRGRRAWFKPYSMKSANTGHSALGQGYLKEVMCPKNNNDKLSSFEINKYNSFGEFKEKNPVLANARFVPISKQRAEALAKLGKLERAGEVYQGVKWQSSENTLILFYYCGPRWFIEKQYSERKMTIRSIIYNHNREQARELWRAGRVTWIEVINHD